MDKPIVERLRQDGHSISAVAEVSPGIDDDLVFGWADAEGVLLLTADKGFGEIVFRQKRIAHGVILLRLAGLSPTAKAAMVSMVIKQHADELAQVFTVISPGITRLRSQER
ncbi:MAG: DUF5615 family PIN-like protein [Chloroflexota bacterium]|nr:DUF5615 family PIN-like protein [Chloroflexota bacterium]